MAPVSLAPMKEKLQEAKKKHSTDTRLQVQVRRPIASQSVLYFERHPESGIGGLNCFKLGLFRASILNEAHVPFALASKLLSRNH